MRVSIPATKSAITAVSTELRALGAVYDKLSKNWKIDQHLVYDALELIERGPSVALRATLAAERGDVAQDRELSSADVYAISEYCAENGIPRGCTLQPWQLAQALSIHNFLGA